MGLTRWGLCLGFVVFALKMQFLDGTTDGQDVMAINNLYLSLDSPPLSGWLPFGGDPCGDGWQGVVCDTSNITEIHLSGMNLGGSLSDTLGDFVSIKVMDFSNNHIGGSISVNLPLTITNFSLAANQLNGSIPFTLSYMSQLLELSLNNNNLTGEIPDVFQMLTNLTNLDVSSNNLTGILPSSAANLSSLNILHLQNNKLTGTLDVLTDLPLIDLDVENNLFSGTIPKKLLSIPNFRKDGNPFDTTIIASPPSPALPPFAAWPPSSHDEPWHSSSSSTRKSWTTQKSVLIIVSVSLALVGLVICIMLWRRCRNRQSNMESDKLDVEAAKDPRNSNEPPSQASAKMGKVSREAMIKPLDGYAINSGKTARNAASASLDYKNGQKFLQQPLPPPPMFSTSDEATKAVMHVPARLKSSTEVSSFTIASLQQFTGSFSEENFITEGLLGNVYKADLPDGNLLAVKKLNTVIEQTDQEFHDLVSKISKLKNDNILELRGYCNEHAQRLLVYEYCPNGSLYDALHVDEEMHKKLTWSVRIRVALGASRALQYLHEACQPAVVHQIFKSKNVLLDEKLAVRVADCGLAQLLPPGYANQNGYAAPEVETGSCTCQSDVYSLGVVMLELLTGRKSYDRTRPRGEHSLARWAIPQIHDIDALSNMVDPSLNGAYPVKALSRFADIIFRCVQMEPGFRPRISEIVQDLLRMI